MLIVILLDLAAAHGEERVGLRRVVAGDELAREGPVGGLDTLCDLGGVGIDTVLHHGQILGYLTLGTRLIHQLGPHGCGLGIGLRLSEELRYGLHVETAAAGIHENAVKSLRRGLAADDGATLRIGDADAHLLETGAQHLLRKKRLPGGVRQPVELRIVGGLASHVVLHLLVDVEILRVGDRLAVDYAHLGVVPRKAHLGFQREDESQKGEADHYGQDYAEFGS